MLVFESEVEVVPGAATVRVFVVVLEDGVVRVVTLLRWCVGGLYSPMTRLISRKHDFICLKKPKLIFKTNPILDIPILDVVDVSTLGPFNTEYHKTSSNDHQ